MSTSAARRAPRTRRRWRLPALALGALVFVLAAVLALAVETRPRATGTGAPDAAAAQAALSAGAVLRDFVESGAADGRLSLTGREIDALLAAAGRLAPGAAAAVRLGPEAVEATLSLGPPLLPAPVWANLRLRLAAGPQGLRVESARLGRLPLPGRLVEAGLARGLDRALDGPGLGRAALAGVVGLTVDGDRLDVDFGYDAAARAALMAQLRARFNPATDGAETGAIFAHLWWLNAAGDEGALPREGTALPYLRHAVERSARMGRRWPEVSDRDLLTAGLLALAVYCGEPALGTAIGAKLRDHMRGAGNHCDGTTLGGRDDLKRHFMVSAGLYAASTGPAAFGIGEIKELIDSGSGGSGFSFDDIAANLAGARFAAAFLAAPKADWPALLARVRAEGDVLPAVSDLPRGLSEAEFRARFGDVDSAAYRAMIAEIERRVDALPFHVAAVGD